MIQTLKNKIDDLLAARISFAVIRFPGAEPILYLEDSATDVIISDWEMNEIDLKTNGHTKDYRSLSSTGYDEYCDIIARVIQKLQKRANSKTIISRIISIKEHGVDWSGVAFRLWQEFPESFGYMFYTPHTGAWLGASPELLFKVNSAGTFSTQALAGTLPVNAEWDEKNIEEQKIVEDYISAVLENYGLKYHKTAPTSLAYGNIKHLSTLFSGDVPQNFDIRNFLRELAPTPALSGYPKQTAINDIKKFENHSRGCYGGFITVRNKEEEISFVTIRCLNFQPQAGMANIFVGSGITAKSIPSQEWTETENKAACLLNIIKDNIK